MASWLIGHGADPSIKDEKIGGTAAGWAEAAGHKELSEYLKEL
jgi:hypothetical protein